MKYGAERFLAELQEAKRAAREHPGPLPADVEGGSLIALIAWYRLQKRVRLSGSERRAA